MNLFLGRAESISGRRLFFASEWCGKPFHGEGGRMRYPNLRYSMGLARLAHYELARELKLSESTLSRKLTGRRDLSPGERARIVEILASASRGLPVDAT
jgi:hypothetical protein